MDFSLSMNKYLNVEPNLPPGINSTWYTIFKTLLDSILIFYLGDIITMTK